MVAQGEPAASNQETPRAYEDSGDGRGGGGCDGREQNTRACRGLMAQAVCTNSYDADAGAFAGCGGLQRARSPRHSRRRGEGPIYAFSCRIWFVDSFAAC